MALNTHYASFISVPSLIVKINIRFRLRTVRIDRFCVHVISCSSPSNPIKSNKPHSQQHKIIIINFQSIKNKKEEIMNLIDQADPSIIMGTETWLNPSKHPPPPNYEVIRKDRHDGYGGVLLAIKKDFIIDSVDINT